MHCDTLQTFFFVTKSTKLPTTEPTLLEQVDELEICSCMEGLEEWLFQMTVISFGFNTRLYLILCYTCSSILPTNTL